MFNSKIGSPKMVFPSNRALIILIGFFALCLGLNAFFLFPDADAYYYWTWSKHLALGYLDGPPLVAYCLRAFTSLLGDTRLALNGYAAVITLGTAYWIFKISSLVSNQKKIGLAAALLWLMSLSTQQNLIFRGGNYDNLELFFWSASTYFVLKYVQQKTDSSLYWAGLGIGLLLLSKYSGIILVVGCLLFFVASAEQRTIFKNKHVYGAGLFALLIFSPNLWWNLQHQGLTFAFQLQAHVGDRSPLFLIFKYLSEFVIYQAYALVLLAFLIRRHGFIQSNQAGWALLWWISSTLFLFWLCFAGFTNVRHTYLTAINILLTCLLAHYLVAFDYRKTLGWTIAACFLTICILVFKFEIKKTPASRAVEFNLLQRLGKNGILANQEPIVSDENYQILAQLAFLYPHHVVSSLPGCDHLAHQFRTWNMDFQRQLEAKKIATVLSVGYENKRWCIQLYFKTCTALPTLEYVAADGQRVLKRLLVYRCNN